MTKRPPMGGPFSLCKHCTRAEFRRWTSKDSNGCWLWIGFLDANGYGQYQRSTKAHRHAWELYRGPIPKGMYVLHQCDVPRCVNPRHLRLGTQKDNALDMILRGRARFHGKSLAPDQVRDIRRRVASGEVQRHIAKELGMTAQSINSVVQRRTWDMVD